MIGAFVSVDSRYILYIYYIFMYLSNIGNQLFLILICPEASHLFAG